jgi:hypothetical protein
MKKMASNIKYDDDGSWTLPENWAEMPEHEQNAFSLTNTLREFYGRDDIKVEFAPDLSFVAHFDDTVYVVGEIIKHINEYFQGMYGVDATFGEPTEIIEEDLEEILRRG